jgi:O-antigen/teichoic acid export membrane protein
VRRKKDPAIPGFGGKAGLADADARTFIKLVASWPTAALASYTRDAMSDVTSRFWRQVGAVLSGTALAQLIPLLGSLAIARLYIPAEFGLFAAWIGAASLAAVAATGRYEVALALEADGAPRRIAARATLVAVLVAGLPLGGGVAFLAAVGGLAGVPAALALWFVPAALVIAACQTWLTWAAAEGRLRELSSLRILQALLVTSAQVGAGMFWPSAASLAIAHTLGAALTLLAASWVLPLWGGTRAGVDESGLSGMRSFWSRRRRFPLLSLPADGINTAAAQLPVLVIGARFGAEVAGHLALTMRVLAVPVALLGSAVLDVFRRRSAQSWREHGHCRDVFQQTFTVLAAGSTLGSIVLALCAEPLFTLAFGPQWRAAGTMALWLLPLFALRFVASPLSYLFYVAEKQHVDLAWQTVLLAMTVATLWLPSGHAAALQAYSLGYCAMYVVYLLLSYRFSRGTHP